MDKNLKNAIMFLTFMITCFIIAMMGVYSISNSVRSITESKQSIKELDKKIYILKEEQYCYWYNYEIANGTKLNIKNLYLSEYKYGNGG
jgi:hypothetical protein